MPADVISIGTKRRAYWSLLEIAQAGRRPVPFGILLADESTGEWTQLLRDFACFDELDEPELDILTELSADLERKAREMGGLRLLESLEDSLSGFFRISDRESIVYSDAEDAHATVNRLFDEHVQRSVRYLPLYGLRAAATKFGEGMDAGEESWVRAPENLRLTPEMFVARVVGRSMEPLISDGDLCIFRAGVAGSRKGRYLLIEKFDETDFASRYTVKRYARKDARDESAERDSPIRLEPLNPAFEAFDLVGDQFRVVAEFVQVLHH
jgi:phage repressor protein C with HTH and peptisase S24 domain